MADDTSLDALRLRLAPAIADGVAFDGWTDAAVTAAAEAEGVDPALARFAFAGGPMAMITAWIARIDADMDAALSPSQLSNLSIRER
ncbi:MAG: COQ9 family protein, partial [Novosphingobium sp.]